jgi:ribonucleoside-diphosphate reductase alpha chain
MPELNGNAKKVAEARYLDGDTWQRRVEIVGRSAASVEHVNQQHYEEKFSQMIYDLDFLPAGRIIRNCGRPRGSLFNCYHVPIDDSREGIGQYYKDSLILWGEGGGVGTNLSFLRPRGAPIRGVGGKSSGPVSFLIASDAIAGTIESGGSRRAAGLAMINVEHPDTPLLIDAKLKDKVLSHYNISIGVTDDFLTSVESDKEWKFHFAQQEYGSIPARKLWKKIISNMIKCAEPGLLNWTNMRRNNSYYYDQVSCTNPCGEAILEPYGVCDLGSIVLPNHIMNVNTNWVKLEETISYAVRFLDNIIDINKYVLDKIRMKAHASRRIGLGVIGMAEYLFAKKMRYGSPDAIREVERVMKFIRDTTYKTLVALAMEKGAFPKFESVEYGKADFVRSLPVSLRMDIKKHGTRCVTGLAIAPTGTISQLAGFTGGIEPLMYKAYLRKDRVGDRIYVHPLYKDLINEYTELPKWFVDSADLSPEDHLDTQASVQKFVDGAVSKTINLPKNFTQSALSDLLLEYIHDLKGVTIYVDGSREGQIYNKMTDKEVSAYLVSEEIDKLTSDEIVNIDCKTGTCEL